MKLWQKIDFEKDNRRITKYKFCDVTLLRNEKSLQKKKTNLLGLKITRKRKRKAKINFNSFVSKRIRSIFSWFDEHKKQHKNKISGYQFVARSEYFDKEWYLNMNPDVVKSGMDPVKHYLKFGWKEGRNPSSLFDGNDYLERYPGVKKSRQCPLVHYEKYGRQEHRVVNPVNKNDYSMSLMKILHFTYLRLIGKLLYLVKFKKNKNARILVCLHLFYMESWPLIKKYLKNLNGYKYDLVVTYIDNHYDSETLQKIKEFEPDAQLYGYPNQGFDIGPFLDVLQKINLNNYDIIYKLHSKGVHRDSIFIYHQIFKKKDWFFNLFDGILGGLSIHQTIDSLLNDKNIGLVASQNLIIQDPKHKQSFTQQVARQNKIKIKPDYHYVAGTCFACKINALNSILEKKYTINDFGEVKRGEFSLAHGLERIVCAVIENDGYSFKGIPTHPPRYERELKQREQNSSLRLLDDDRFQLDYDFFYKALEGRQIYSYEVAKIKIKDINRRWVDGKIYSIKDTSAYAYLHGDTARYEEYCEINSENSVFNMSRERYDLLTESVRKSFNDKMMPILDGEGNIIQDGQHRLAILLDKYGENYEVTCLKLYYHDIIQNSPSKFPKRAENVFYDSGIRKNLKTLAVFSAFSANGKIPERVIYYLQELKKVCDGIIFIADNPLLPNELDKIRNLIIYAEASRHEEYDFGSYKRGYLYARNNHLLDNAKELIFCNDSCYGPIFPLNEMFSTMRKARVNFWGMCANDDLRYHIQSYFMVFNRQVFTSSIFYEFMTSVTKEISRKNVIMNYETKLTTILNQQGFKCKSYIPFNPDDTIYPYKYKHNLTYFPVYLLKNRAPLIKVKIIDKTFHNFDGDEKTLEYIKNINPKIYKIILDTQK